MSYNPNNANGQATMANSAPVVIASDQSNVAVSQATAANLNVTAVQATGSNLHIVNDAGSAIIGKVGIDQTTPGTTNLVALAANQSINNAQVAGNTTSTGNGVVGTGVQRVAIASDNTAFAVNATLSAETTKVIGTVNMASAQTIAATQSGTWTVQPGNTANTTPWLTKISDGTNAAAIKAASTAASATDPAVVVAISPNNSVAITQATPANLNATVSLAASQTLATVTTITTLTNGAAPHLFGFTLFHKDAVYSTTQTTTAIWTPTSGKKFVVTDITITTGGTTAGVVTLYDASSATAYNAGTTPAIFRGEFAPSSTSKPGMVKNFIVPYVSTAANNLLYVTTSAAINPLYIQINGYEI